MFFGGVNVSRFLFFGDYFREFGTFFGPGPPTSNILYHGLGRRTVRGPCPGSADHFRGLPDAHSDSQFPGVPCPTEQGGANFEGECGGS